MSNVQLRSDLRSSKEKWEIRQGYYLDLLGLVVPLAAPLVPAYLTATAIIEHYPGLLHIEQGWVIGMGIIAGAVIEVLGILSIETMFDMRTFNATVQEGEEKAPFEWAAGAVAFYLVLVMMLVLLLKIAPQMALWSLAPLTILGFITSWVMVLRKQHSERVWKRESTKIEQSEIERLKAQVERLNVELNEQNEQAKSMRLEHAEQLQRERVETERLRSELAAMRERPQPQRSKAKKVSAAKIDPEQVHRYFQMNPDATYRQASADLGCSIGTISNIKPKPVLNGGGSH